MLRILPLLLLTIFLAACAPSANTTQSTLPAFQPAPDPTPLKLVIVGDSTVANYPTTVPDRGWGQFIGEYFNTTVTTVNLAKNGRPYDREMVIEDIQGQQRPEPYQAALQYQQKEHMERSVEYGKKVLDLGIKWRS